MTLLQLLNLMRLTWHKNFHIAIQAIDKNLLDKSITRLSVGFKREKL